MAFLSAIVLALYRYRLETWEKSIKAVPEQERAALVHAALGRFNISTERLTKQQAFDLAIEEIHARSRRFIVIAMTVGLIAVFGLAVLFVYTPLKGGPPPLSEGLTDKRLGSSIKVGNIDQRVNNGNAVAAVDGEVTVTPKVQAK